MRIIEVVPIPKGSTPFTEEMLVLDGAGLKIESGVSVKFKDIAARDEEGRYIFPPENKRGYKLPYIMRSYKKEGEKRLYENINLITPSDMFVRYKTWLGENFTFTIRDLLRFLCIYENKEFRKSWLGDPCVTDYDVCCRDCKYSKSVNGHVATATCEKDIKHGKFRFGDDVCRFFKEEFLRDGVPTQ